jgi:type IV pilus assembly protein PilB
VAMTDVRDLKLLDHLRDLTDMTINPILGSSEDIKTSIERYYRDISSQNDATNLIADFETDVQYIQDQREDISVEEAVAAGAELGIIKLVNMLIVNAVRDKASDVHIEPMENYLVVRYRIDGDLRRVMSPPRKSHQAIITRIKILANLDIAERRLPHDGRMVVKMGHKEIDIRVSILPTVFGEKAVLRILDKEAFERNISNLGFDESNIEIFRSHITRPYGMIIVTGPTGSGKSTTLYSAIQTIKNVKRNIITVEDPVEYNIDGVSQLHVNTKIGLTFATALRSILRQDPDIILIGEIRDDETADIAVKMALTGHLVFSTLHTNDAAGAVARFVDMNIPPLLLGSSLNLIIAQRLVRKICPKCKVQYKPEQELMEQLGIDDSPDLIFYKGKGCVICNGTGYSGRIGIFEMIEVSKSIKRLILKNRSTQKINETAKIEGMKTLRQSGIEKVLLGITTIEQVIAVTSD